MDTFSSTVSTFKVPRLPPQTNREFYYQFKRTPYATPNRATQPHVSSSTSINTFVPKTKNPNFSHRRCFTSSLPFSNSSSKTSSSSHLRQQPSSPIFHTSPATGYAAAIIDVAQTTNSLHLVHMDVQRLLRFLQSDLVEEIIKGQVVKHVVQEQGMKFHRHVVTLLKMLIKKNKIGIVHQVLEEFERIYDELCGTQVVLVSSSATKIGEDELFGIAKRVQQLSGAMTMRVKLRNMVQVQQNRAKLTHSLLL